MTIRFLLWVIDSTSCGAGLLICPLVYASGIALLTCPLTYASGATLLTCPLTYPSGAALLTCPLADLSDACSIARLARSLWRIAAGLLLFDDRPAHCQLA